MVSMERILVLHHCKVNKSLIIIQGPSVHLDAHCLKFLPHPQVHSHFLLHSNTETVSYNSEITLGVVHVSPLLPCCYQPSCLFSHLAAAQTPVSSPLPNSLLCSQIVSVLLQWSSWIVSSCLKPFMWGRRAVCVQGALSDEPRNQVLVFVAPNRKTVIRPHVKLKIRKYENMS